MTALAGSGVAVTNPVASRAAAANPIGSFILESSMRGVPARCKLSRLQAKAQRATKMIYSYITAALHRLADVRSGQLQPIPAALMTSGITPIRDINNGPSTPPSDRAEQVRSALQLNSDRLALTSAGRLSGCTVLRSLPSCWCFAEEGWLARFSVQLIDQPGERVGTGNVIPTGGDEETPQLCDAHRSAPFFSRTSPRTAFLSVSVVWSAFPL